MGLVEQHRMQKLTPGHPPPDMLVVPLNVQFAFVMLVSIGVAFLMGSISYATVIAFAGPEGSTGEVFSGDGASGAEKPSRDVDATSV